ncbi:hypothetical protein [Geoalkalibacter sp.]|uniref:NADH-quinone oxidoreductase subunit B family protein n=1 Tax=Geoalkalibacter sp. TaxID=3041440 RepID=UPI00272E39DD|nr:hypothetical protein [Geoalkalibacter sp.]
MAKLRVLYERLTSCCGCQLSLLNCEEELTALAEGVELVAFPMASSRPDDGRALDVVLIEGSVSAPEEIRRLMVLRRRATWLVAVGACALSGGINALGSVDRGTLCTRVYGEQGSCLEVFPPQPLRRFVTLDLQVPGCPPEGGELLGVLGALLRGGLPALPDFAVCMECRLRENLCLLQERRLPCLGPVTRAGCQARCPSLGVACEGCRGWAAEANRGEAFRLLIDLGLGEGEIRRRMTRFAGGDHETVMP